LSSDHTTAFLLERVREGHAAARESLVARLQPMLERFAHGRLPARLRGAQDTVDVIQLTWMRTLDKLEGFEPGHPGAFFAYLREVLLNVIRAELRKRAPESIAPLDSPAAQAIPLAGVSAEDWVAYEQALAGLEPERRALVLMRYEFGMSYAEIALELQDTPDAVRMKVNRAIKALSDPGAGTQE